MKSVREIQVFWNKVFDDHRRQVEPTKSPHMHVEGLLAPGTEKKRWTPVSTSIGGDPLMPTADVNEGVYRPFTPLICTEGVVEEDQDKRAGFIYEIMMNLVRYGADYVKEGLRRLGYNLKETQSFCKEARLQLADDHLQTDVEEHKAVSIARMNRIYRQADDALDHKIALAAQKHLDRITGVTKDEAAGGLGDLAALARMVTNPKIADQSVRNVVDADYEEAEGPAKPPMQILSDEEIKEIEEAREEQ